MIIHINGLSKEQVQYQGTKYAVIGQTTDDSDSTLANSLIRMKKCDKNYVILSYEK